MNRHKIGTGPDGKAIWREPCKRISIRAADVNTLIGDAVEAWRGSSSHYAIAARRHEGIATERARLSAERSDWQQALDDLLPTRAAASRSAFVSARDELLGNIARIDDELAALSDDGEGDVPDVLDDWDNMPGAARRRFAPEVIAVPIKVMPSTKSGPKGTPASERLVLLPYAEGAAA
jgi:hypothetical protein